MNRFIPMKANLILILAGFSISVFAYSQDITRTISDNGKKFYYNKEQGITPSYTSYFGKSFAQRNLQTISGRNLLKDSLKRKVVVYNFWFTQCRPCIAEMPALNKLYDRIRSDSVEFIGITFDDSTTIRKFLAKNEFHFNIVSLDQNSIWSMKKMSYYPMTFIINRRQEISYALFGRVGGKNPDEELSGLLESKIRTALKE